MPPASFTRTPACTGLPRAIVTPARGPIAQVIAGIEQLLLPLHHSWLGRRHALHDTGEILGHDDRRKARRWRIFCTERRGGEQREAGDGKA